MVSIRFPIGEIEIFESVKAMAREFGQNASPLNPIVRANIDFVFPHCAEPRDLRRGSRSDRGRHCRDGLAGADEIVFDFSLPQELILRAK